MTLDEEWRPIADFDAYEVSSHGRVRRVKRARFGKPVPHPVVPYDSIGYAKVHLHQDGRTKRALVHRLVAETFIGPRPEGKFEVAHRDGGRRNNRVDNLRWASFSENNLDKHAHGRMIAGASHHWTKITPSTALSIKRMLREGRRNGDIAKAHGVNHVMVCDINSGRSWAHLKDGDEHADAA